MKTPDDKRVLNADEKGLTKDTSSSELLEKAKVARRKEYYSSAPLACVHRGTSHRGHASFFIKLPDYLEHIPVCGHHKEILIREAESLGIQALEVLTPDHSFAGGDNYAFYRIGEKASDYRKFLSQQKKS